MIDVSSQLLLDTNTTSSKSDFSQVSDKSNSQQSQSFSKHMEDSTSKSSKKVENRDTEAKSVASKSEKNVTPPESQDKSVEQSESNTESEVTKLSDDGSDEQTKDDTDALVEGNSEAIESNDESEKSTASLISLLLQHNEKTNTGDEAKGLENSLLANKNKTNFLDNLIQKQLAGKSGQINPDLLAEKGAELDLEKVSPELLKLLLKSDKGLNSGSNKGSDIKQDLLGQLQLNSIDDVLELDQDSSDLLARLLEKIDTDKNKGESLFQNRLMGDKANLNAELVDLNRPKISTEVTDKNVLLSAANSTDRINNNSPIQQLKMNTPVTSPEWGAEFGKRIQMLMKNNIQQAEIRLDPPELGRIQIRINMNQEHANVSFSALHSNVREAIESNMSRLRDMLGESGLQLGDADVNPQFQEQSDKRADDQHQFTLATPSSDEVDEFQGREMPASVIQKSVDGLIDYFA